MTRATRKKCFCYGDTSVFYTPFGETIMATQPCAITTHDSIGIQLKEVKTDNFENEKLESKQRAHTSTEA